MQRLQVDALSLPEMNLCHWPRVLVSLQCLTALQTQNLVNLANKLKISLLDMCLYLVSPFYNDPFYVILEDHVHIFPIALPHFALLILNVIDPL